MSVLHYDESVTELRFLQKRYSAIYKDFRNLSNSSPVQSFPNKRLWSLDFAFEIVLRPLPRRTAILESDKSLTFIKRHIRKSCALIVHIEKRLSLKDGNSLWLLSTAFPFRQQKEGGHFLPLSLLYCISPFP